MDPNDGGQGPPASLSKDSLPLFSEAVHLVLLQWTALRLAVENEWGGRNSRKKFEQLEADILSWFTSSKDTLYIDDLEMILDEGMILSFNAEIEDGSIQEVAEQLMTVHEECLLGNFGTLFKLRASNGRGHGVYESRQDSGSADDSSNEDEDPASEMEVETNPVVDRSSAYTTNSQIQTQNGGNVLKKSQDHASNIPVDLDGQPSMDVADGWTVIISKRNRGRNSK